MNVEAIKRSLDGSGLRRTPQRYAVMAFLMECNRHPTAAEIFEAVNRVDPRSSRATTYNNLRDLVQAGLVRTSSATAAAMLRTLNGTTCPGLPQARSVSECFANASSFSGGSARSALRGAHTYLD